MTNPWNKLPDSWKHEIHSAVQTFVAAAVLALGEQLTMNGGHIPLGKDALFALGVVVVRSGVKALYVWVMCKMKKV